MNDLYFRIATLLWSAWLVSWVAAALWVSRQTAAADNSAFRGQLALAFAGFALLFLSAPGRAGAAWRVPDWLGWVAVVLVAIGVIFAWWARLHLGRLWSGGVVTREGHRIVDSGPYGLVRHPIYTGLILSAIGLAIVKATWVAPIGAALVALGFGLKAKVEERFLAAELGAADYAAYRRRVPMLVPFARTR